MSSSDRRGLDAPEYLKTPAVLRLLRIGRKRLNEAVAKGMLPAPVMLGPRCRVWDAQQIKRHLAELAREKPKGSQP